MWQSRRLAATLSFLWLVTGCASLAPERTAIAPVAAPSMGYPMHPEDLVAGEEGDEGEGERGTAVSAIENLRRESDEHGPPSAAQILRAHEQRKALALEAPSPQEKRAGLQPSRWEALGPSNVGGRVRALAFDPGNAFRLLAGAASGGLWISTDAGTSWRANSDFLPNLSITSIVFDPLNRSVVYAGTGEASQGLVGIGVFKSSDGGETWVFLAATNVDANPDWRFVNRLAVHPTQTSIVLAAMTNNNRTSGAIYRSTDGGNSWAKASSLKALDIAFDPNDPRNAVAGLDNGKIAFSRDSGATWTETAPLVDSPSGRQNTARAEIAFSRSQRGVVYASVDNNKGEVWRSDDSGASWQLLSTPAHLNNQGDYDNSIWVDPTDANHVVGGIL